MTQEPIENETSTLEDTNIPENTTEQIPSDETGIKPESDVLSQESDVLELDYGVEKPTLIDWTREENPEALSC